MRNEISTTTKVVRAPVARVAASKHFLPAILFAVCFGVYVGNGDFLPGNDQVGNMLFSANLLKRHSFAISPPVAPQAFFWTIAKPGQEPVPTAIEEWTESTGAAYREGRLAATSHFYYASPNVFPEVYVNTFGVGAPLAGAPVYAVLDLFVDIEHDRFWWWHGAALTASLLTALAALFVFLAARGFAQPVPAALIALAFGLGSCAWPVSSQALWQHPVSTFLLRPRRLVAAAQRGAPAGCRLVRGGARDGGAVPPHRRGGGAVHGSISAVRGPPPVRRLRARRAAVPGARLRAERGSGWHRAFEDGLRRPVAEFLARESARPVVQPGTGPGLVLARAAARLGQRGVRVARPALPSPDPVVPLQLGTVLMILVAGKWFDWSGGLTRGCRCIVDAA